MSIQESSNMSESSTSDLSSEWDVVPSFTHNGDNNEHREQVEDTTLIEAGEAMLDNAMDTTLDEAKGTTVEEIEDTTLTGVENATLSEDSNIESQTIPKVEEIEISCHSSKSSNCSDIEVIDENVDLGPAVSVLDMTVPQTTLISSSTEVVHTDNELSQIDLRPEMNLSSPSTDADDTRQLTADSGSRSDKSKPLKRKQKNQLSTPCIVLFWLLACVLSYMNYSSLCTDDLQVMIKQMKQLTETFRAENAELRDQLLSEMRNKNMYSSLEEQITELKNENLKLNQMLQNMISDLQKPWHHAESALLNKEVNKLREHINTLRFENEELQKQAAKLRYSGHAAKSVPEESLDKSTDSAKKSVPEESLDKSTDSAKLSSGKDRHVPKDGLDKDRHVPNDELDKDSDSKKNESDEPGTRDVNKLHQELISEIEKIKQWNEIIEAITNQLHKSESKKENKWSFSDMKQSLNNIVQEAQKNVADTVNHFQKMNVTDMFSKYINYDEKAAKDMLSSIKGYLTETKEKTVKILNQNIDGDAVIKNTFDKVNKKWKHVKEYFGMSDNAEHHESEEKNNEHHKNNAQNSMHAKARQANKRDAREFHENMRNVHDESPGGNWYFKKNQDVNAADNKDSESESWLFGRAAYRAKERKQDDSVNWYLKRKKYQQRNMHGEEYMDEHTYPHH